MFMNFLPTGFTARPHQIRVWFPSFWDRAHHTPIVLPLTQAFPHVEFTACCDTYIIENYAVPPYLVRDLAKRLKKAANDKLIRTIGFPLRYRIEVHPDADVPQFLSCLNEEDRALIEYCIANGF